MSKDHSPISTRPVDLLWHPQEPNAEAFNLLLDALHPGVAGHPLTHSLAHAPFRRFHQKPNVLPSDLGYTWASALIEHSPEKEDDLYLETVGLQEYAGAILMLHKDDSRLKGFLYLIPTPPTWNAIRSLESYVMSHDLYPNRHLYALINNNPETQVFDISSPSETYGDIRVAQITSRGNLPVGHQMQTVARQTILDHLGLSVATLNTTMARFN